MKVVPAVSIDFLSYDYPPNDGGISRLAAEVVARSSGRGHQIRVLTLAPGSATGPVRPDVATVEVPRRKGAREWATLAWLCGGPRSTVALATVWNPEATLLWLLQRRYVVMAHGNEVMPYPPGPRMAMRRWLRARVLLAARWVVCNSRYTERLVRAAAPAARTVVIPPGVDCQHFQPAADRLAARARFGLPADRRMVLSVARLDTYKGHDVVLRALAALPPAARDRLQYVVAGKGEHQSALHALAAQLGVTANVTWLGFVADGDLPDLYASADLFVLCTREDPQARGVEGFGMVFLEAQASGVAVLGTRAGGIPDAIDEGRGGWLVPQDDVAAVAAHLQTLAADPAPYHAMGRSGRARVLAECDWSHYTDRLLPLLDADT